MKKGNSRMTENKARESIVDALERSRQGYVADITTLLHDNQLVTKSPPRENLKTRAGAERMAKRIMKLLFDE